MTRPLRIVVGPQETFRALRDTLAAVGPAILPSSGVAGAEAPPAAAPFPLPATVGHRVAVVIETSGTTGRPKRVALSADALLASAAASASALGGSGQWLLALPAHYIAGVNVLVRSIASGLDPVIMDMVSSHFTAEGFATATAQLEGPNLYTSLVPAQVSTLLDDVAGVAALRRFSAVLVGGQAMPQELLAAARGHGVAVRRTYGSSETSGGCVYEGRPIGQTEVRVRGGEVEIAGPVLAEGYLGDPELTDARFVVDEGKRWFRTGDAGTFADGVLRVTGRLDDVIISGGIKVSLGDVERTVRQLPGLAEALVIRASSQRWGEVPVVVTTVPCDLQQVREFVSARLGREAAPDRVVLLPVIPLLDSGKPDVRKIRASLTH